MLALGYRSDVRSRCGHRGRPTPAGIAKLAERAASQPCSCRRPQARLIQCWTTGSTISFPAATP